MKRIIIATAAVMMVGMSGLKAQDNITKSQYEEYIQVTGTAERKIVPDEIYLKIVINENDTKGKMSVEKAEEEMIAKLQALGIDTDKNMSIYGMTSQLKKYWMRKNQSRTNFTYELKVDSADMFGKVSEALDDIGISRIEVEKVTHSKMKDIRNELRVEAMKDAQKIAMTLAGAVGQSIKEAVYIVDYNYEPGVKQHFDSVIVGYGGSVNSSYKHYETPLDFRQIKITHSITAKFRLWYK